MRPVLHRSSSLVTRRYAPELLVIVVVAHIPASMFEPLLSLLVARGMPTTESLIRHALSLYPRFQMNGHVGCVGCVGMHERCFESSPDPHVGRERADD